MAGNRASINKYAYHPNHRAMYETNRHAQRFLRRQRGLSCTNMLAMNLSAIVEYRMW